MKDDDTQPTKALGIRARNRLAIENEILSIASAQLGVVGAAGLSLRSVARELGMTSSAIYRYVESRDELLTRLIVITYDDLAASVKAAFDDTQDESPEDRFRSCGLALRQWALNNVHQFSLIYGSPVPDYHAPEDRTTFAGTRVPMLFAKLLSDVSGVRLGEDPTGADFDFADPAFQRGFAAWTLLLGAVTSEVFEQMGQLQNPELIFGTMLDIAISIVDSGAS